MRDHAQEAYYVLDRIGVRTVYWIVFWIVNSMFVCGCKKGR